jgi:hypothetical protein
MLLNLNQLMRRVKHCYAEWKKLAQVGSGQQSHQNNKNIKNRILKLIHIIYQETTKGTTAQDAFFAC